MIIMGGSVDLWGLIPTFLQDDDKRPAKEQFNERYVSGWHPFEGFELNKQTMELTYPGDPPTKMLSIMFFNGETIVLYEHEWVMILGLDGSWEVCRMD